MDPKQGPEGQTPNNSKDRQVGVSRVRLDKRGAKSGTDSDARLAQRRDNLQKEAIPPPIGTREDAIYDQEDKGRRGRRSSADLEIPKTTPKQGNTATAKLTPKGKGEQLAPHRKGNQENETIEPGSKTQQRERKQTTKWKITPIAGARPVPLQSAEPHHPDMKNKDSSEKGEGVT